MTFLSLVAVLSSLLVVTAPNTVISVLWLVVVFITTSLLLGLIGLGYAALLYVIVYVGAIAIIFLFVVQLLGSNTNLSRLNNWVRFLHVSTTKNALSNPHQQQDKADENSPSSVQSTWLAKGTATLPIATLISLSIIYIFVQLTADQLDEKGWSSIVQEVFSTPFSPISSIYDLFIAAWWVSTPAQVQPADLVSSGPGIAWTSDLIKPLSPTSVGAISGYNTSQVYNLAEWLYNGATIGLLIASIVLLLAMIAPIVLCQANGNNS